VWLKSGYELETRKKDRKFARSAEDVAIDGRCDLERALSSWLSECATASTEECTGDDSSQWRCEYQVEQQHFLLLLLLLALLLQWAGGPPCRR